MIVDFELETRIAEKRIKYNTVLREKYKMLVKKEKELNGGANRRMTLKRVAARTGISYSYISVWLAEKRSFDFPYLDAIAYDLAQEGYRLEDK